MLGNFSIGGYFKKQAIDYAYDLLFNVFNIEKDLLYFTVYEKDEEAYDL
jgi:alanyl-tRNA synthetase